jgi:hypothetical protein
MKQDKVHYFVEVMDASCSQKVFQISEILSGTSLTSYMGLAALFSTLLFYVTEYVTIETH